MHSYPWYFRDWRGSRARTMMNSEQKGIYRELIDFCVEVGSLPIDEAQLIRIAGADKKEWKRSWPIVREFFAEKDNRLYNNKVDETRAVVLKSKEDRRKGAAAANEKRAQRIAQREAGPALSDTLNTTLKGTLKARPLYVPTSLPTEETLPSVESLSPNVGGGGKQAARSNGAAADRSGPEPGEPEPPAQAVRRILSDPEIGWGDPPGVKTCLRICAVIDATEGATPLDWAHFVGTKIDAGRTPPDRSAEPYGWWLSITRDEFPGWFQARRGGAQ
jgi:uncharacterized protein YdaU (DUF1376 family)